jgi:hypothetical protein
MNDMPAQERAELARRLPPPAVPELSDDRRRELKDAFMQTITDVRDPRPARHRWAVFAAPATALAVAAVAIGAGVLGPSADGPRGTAAPIVAVEPGSAAGPLFDRLARAAAGRPDVPVGSGQYVYVRSKVAWLVFPKDVDEGPKMAGEDAQVLDEVHDREIWLPSSEGDEGLIRERGETFGLDGARPNSRYATLPTDPDALLRRIYADTEGQGQHPDDQAFDFIGETLHETILPPELLAALYRAAAKIPGVVLVKDSVDAAGRHGIAVGRTDQHGERREWIFDPATFDYLGERSYLVRDNPAIGAKGMLTGTTAVLQRGVVDKPGQLPR